MITANDRYSGNHRYSGIKGPDRFFHYSGRCLYNVLTVAIIFLYVVTDILLPVLNDKRPS